MRTLLLLRHAKSSWKKRGLADHDRPLNGRGKRDAPRMGRLLITENLRPDVIASSTALRAKGTVELVVEAGALDGVIAFTESLYLAGPESMLDVLRMVPEEAATVLLVGHNPGMESLLALLTGCHESVPTAALCQLTVDIAMWEEIGIDSTARLVNLRRPRDLISL